MIRIAPILLSALSLAAATCRPSADMAGLKADKGGHFITSADINGIIDSGAGGYWRHHGGAEL